MVPTPIGLELGPPFIEHLFIESFMRVDRGGERIPFILLGEPAVSSSEAAATRVETTARTIACDWKRSEG